MQTPLLGERTRRRAAFLINFTFWALFFAVFWVAGRVITQTLLPFVGAFLLAACLQKPLAFLKKRYRFTHRFACTFLVAATLLLIGGAVTAGVWQGGLWLIRLIKDEQTLVALQQWGTDLTNAVSRLIPRLEAVLPAEYTALLTEITAHIQTALIDYGASLLTALSGGVMSFAVRSLPRFLLSALFFILAFVFFVKDFNPITAFCMRQVPVPQRPLVKAAATALKSTTFSIGKAYLLLGMVTFSELAFGFWLLGIPRPLLWAALTAIVDALPILGVGAVLFPIAAVRFLNGSIGGGVAVLILYAAVTVVRNLLQPRFVSRETGLPALITLLTMYLGWRVSGLLGLLTAPILAMVLLRLQKEGHLRIFK